MNLVIIEELWKPYQLEEAVKIMVNKEDAATDGWTYNISSISVSSANKWDK